MDCIVHGVAKSQVNFSQYSPRTLTLWRQRRMGRGAGMQKATEGPEVGPYLTQQILSDTDLSGNKNRSCRASKVVHKADHSR